MANEIPEDVKQKIREAALDYVELLSQDAHEDRMDLHFSEDNLVKWLCEFAALQLEEKEKEITRLKGLVKDAWWRFAYGSPQWNTSQYDVAWQQFKTENKL